MAEKEKVNLTLTASLVTGCERLTEKLGIGKSAIVELAVREFAERNGIPIEATEQEPQAV